MTPGCVSHLASLGRNLTGGRRSRRLPGRLAVATLCPLTLWISPGFRASAGSPEDPEIGLPQAASIPSRRREVEPRKVACRPQEVQSQLTLQESRDSSCRSSTGKFTDGERVYLHVSLQRQLHG